MTRQGEHKIGQNPVSYCARGNGSPLRLAQKGKTRGLPNSYVYVSFHIVQDTVYQTGAQEGVEGT